MKVEQYLTQVDYPQKPTTDPSPWMAGQAGQGLASIGGAAQDFAAALQGFITKKKRLDESLEAAKLFNEARQQVQYGEIELAKKPDEVTHVPASAAMFDKITGDILEKSSSKNVRMALEKAFADLRTERMGAAKDFAFKTYLSKATGLYLQNLFEFKQRAIKEPNESERVRIMGEAQALIDSIATDLGRDPKADWREFQRETVNGMVASDIGIDPRKAKGKLELGGYKGIWEEDRPIYLDKADRAIKAEEAEIEKQKVDQEAKYLMSTFGTAYELIFNRLRDPQYLEERGITSQQKHTLEILFTQERNHFDEIQTRVHKQTGVEAIDQWVKGSLTPQQINSWVNSDKMNPDQGKAWIISIEARNNASRTVKTDDKTYIEILDAITAAGGREEDLNKIRTYMAMAVDKKLLGRVEYEHLFNLTDASSAAVFKDEYFKMTDSWMKEQLAGPSGLGLMGQFLDPSGTASQAYISAKIELIKAVKEKGLKGDDIFRMGTQIVLPKRDAVMRLLKGGTGGVKEETPKSNKIMGPISKEVEVMLPPAKDYTNRVIKDKQTGNYYKSDGKKWWLMK